MERASLNSTFLGFEDVYFDTPEREKFIEESRIAEEEDDFGWYAEFGYTACQGIQMVQLATDAGLSTGRIAEYGDYADAMRAANIEMLLDWKKNGNNNQFGVNHLDEPDALRIDQCSDDCNGGTFLDFFGGERDTTYRNPSDGKMSPKHHTSYIQAFDDSLECFLDVGKCNGSLSLPLAAEQRMGHQLQAVRKSRRAAVAKLYRTRVNGKRDD